MGIKPIDVGKTVAIDAGKKLVEKGANKSSTFKTQVTNVMVPPEKLQKKWTKLYPNILIQVQLILTDWLMD